MITALTALIVIATLYALVAAGVLVCAFIDMGLLSDALKLAWELLLLVMVCVGWPLFIRDFMEMGRPRRVRIIIEARPRPVDEDAP